MSLTPPQIDFNKIIVDAVGKAVKEKAEEIYEEKKKELVERLDKEKADTIAGICLRLMRYVEMQTEGQKIVLTIVDRTENK